ncbi:MAG: glycosyl hydrolase [Ignavibacteria bacterium]|nr:glycosyl hydrolase [Ignavibacteria bacterium]
MKIKKCFFALVVLTVVMHGCVTEVDPPFTPSYKIYGLCFSPYKDGQNPNNSVQITEAQIREMRDIVVPYTTWIRTFGMDNGLENIPRIAHENGLKVAAGAWISNDHAANQTQVLKLIEKAKQGHVDIAVVGSEVILRDSTATPQLIALINQVKDSLPNIQVTTDDVYGTFLDHPELVSAVDLVMANIYPYWEGVDVDCAPKFINYSYDFLVSRSQGKEVIIGETGWPSSGNTVGNAVPSPENAGKYFLNYYHGQEQRI